MPDEIMKETLQFLRDLSKNNNKNWFDANKDRYLAAKSSVETLAGELLSGIRSFDDTVGPLSPKDCTYRIYRDLRFSKDKTPYKTHMGLYINQGGKRRRSTSAVWISDNTKTEIP